MSGVLVPTLWRERSIFMKEEYQKQRYTVWLSKDAIQKSDAAVTREDFANRSAFIERAIHFYSGYLYEESHKDFLSMKGIVKTSENHLARLLFKIAVEMAKLESMLAAINDMDEATMRRLHIRCVNEVKKINGILTMEDAVRYQRSDEE